MLHYELFSMIHLWGIPALSHGQGGVVVHLLQGRAEPEYTSDDELSPEAANPTLGIVMQGLLFNLIRSLKTLNHLNIIKARLF